MRRRRFISLVCGAAATWPLAARAQQPDRMRLVGVLMGYAENDQAALSEVAIFRGALAKLGRNAAISASKFAGEPVMRISLEHLQRNWLICGPT
jgi:hypothetical protein